MRLRRPRRPKRNATGPRIAMRVTTAIAAVPIAIETAIGEIATAIETFGATARGIRAGTDVHAATIRGWTTVPDNQNAARTPRVARRRGKSKHPVKSKRLVLQTKDLVLQTRRLDPSNRRAPINLATKASALPTNAASAVSEADEAAAGAAAADAMAAKTTRMAQAQAQAQAPATPRDRATVQDRATLQDRLMGIWAIEHRGQRPRRLPASGHLLNRHPSKRRVIRHLHAPPRRRRRARERTTNMSCGPLPRATFSGLARTSGNEARAVLLATRR